MARVRKSYMIAAGTLAVLGALWGCNGSEIDDEEFSDSVLVVDGVEPASVQADVSPDVDPNSGLASPPADDVINISVRNLNRTQSGSGIFGDIQISSFDVDCTNALGGLPEGSSTGNPSSLTIPAESSAGISVGFLSGAFKQANAGTLVGTTSTCKITFHGRDLSGEPILSQEAIVGVNFVDTP